MNMKLLYKVAYGRNFASLHEVGNEDKFIVEIKLWDYHKTFEYNTYNHACYKFDCALNVFKDKFKGSITTVNC